MGRGEAYVVNEKVEVVVDDPRALHQPPILALVPVRPARELEHHHVLQHPLFILIHELAQLGRADGRVQLQQRPGLGDGGERGDVREEERDVARGRVDRGVGDVEGVSRGVLVRRRVGRDELGAGGKVELLERVERVGSARTGKGEGVGQSYEPVSRERVYEQGKKRRTLG